MGEPVLGVPPGLRFASGLSADAWVSRQSVGPDYDRNPPGIHREPPRQERFAQDLCLVVFASNAVRQERLGDYQTGNECCRCILPGLALSSFTV